MATRIGRAFGDLVTVVALALGVGVGVVAPTFGIGFAPVLTPSMRPALAEGELLVVRAMDTALLDVGRIVLLADTTGGGGADVVAHRIVALERDGTGTHVHTQGDANPAPDAGPRTIVAPSTGVVVASVPLLGHVALALSSLPVRLVVGALVFTALVLATRRTMRGGPHATSSAR